MMIKLAKICLALSALAALGLAPATAFAETAKDTGRMDNAFIKRDVQPIPDQEGHILMLSESTGKATSPGGPLDGFAVTVRELVDLRQGSGPHQGYVIFEKGGDRQVVRFEGNITTVLKDGKPNTTMKGSYQIVGATGALAGAKGSGAYSGSFSSEDNYHVDWDGTRSGGKDTVAESGKD